MAPGYGDRGDGTCQLLAIQNSVPPHLTAPAPPQGPSRDLIVELDNTTLTSTSVDSSVGLTVRRAAPPAQQQQAGKGQACRRLCNWVHWPALWWVLPAAVGRWHAHLEH